MKNYRTFAVIGLGRFGYQVAKTLLELGQSVIAIDKDETVLESISKLGADVYIMNSINKESLAECGLNDADVVVIGIGKDIEASILAALNAIELGVKRVVCKANSDDHAKILEKIGAEIIFPEIDIAKRLAYSVTNALTEDILPLSDDFSIIQMKVPYIFDSKTVEEINLRQKYNLNLIAIVHDGKATGNITPKTMLYSSDSMYICGTNKNITEFQDKLK
ncbi:MAG: TrkA family potassium uptake protein [Spirochaetales bacterium]|nr:TrkA family potassium uptake protein [Spirochaetales bacterium]